MTPQTSTGLNEERLGFGDVTVSLPIASKPPRDDRNYVIHLEKPKESFEELCEIFKSLHPNLENYEVKKGIVSCNSCPTSISPYIFNKLSDEEKELVAKNPNSDIAIALLQNVE